MLRSIAIVSCALLAACQPAAAPGTPCTRASDCPSPLVCSYGACHAQCTASSDCPIGARCIASSAGSVCTLDTENHCDTAVCPTPLACIADTCRTPCSAANECIAGLCAMGRCVEPVSAGPVDAAQLDVGASDAMAGRDVGPTNDANVPRVYFFHGGQSNGALGGRAGADARCMAYRGTLPVTQVHAFLTVSSADDFRSMPSNYLMPIDVPFVGPTGIEVAPNFAALVGSPLTNTLVAAGAIPAVGGTNLTSDWYSGADYGIQSMGPSINGNCSGFTTATRGAMLSSSWFSEHGSGTVTDSGWIESVSSACDDPNTHVLCVGW